MSTAEQQTAVVWHTLDIDEVCHALETQTAGLSDGQARDRLKTHGRNELPREPAPTRSQILLRQFKSPLIYVLLFAAILALVIGEVIDAAFIGLVLVINALIGSWQEWKAEQSSRALQKLLEVRATVVRDGEVREISAEELVPGDLVWLPSGNRVPADVRLLSARGLETDESLLTGESLAVSKHPDWRGDEDAPIADRKNMAFAGSVVVHGRGKGVVVATGARTMVGQLAVDVIRAAGAETPLMERMERFSRTVATVVLVSAVIVGVLGILVHQYGLVEMLMFGVALAVSAIPEGLPITITVALAIATTRMARRGVIVRRLAAVEGLGSCTLIASDKTGTLTVNGLTVREVRLADGNVLEITGQGFVPEGEVRHDGRPVEPDRLPELDRLVRIAVLCNESDLHRSDPLESSLQAAAQDRIKPELQRGEWTWRGDPTDIALLTLGEKLGRDRKSLLKTCPQVNDIPFEPERRFAASFHRVEDGRIEAFVKGALEQVLAMCDFDDEQVPERLQQAAHEMAEQGYRVLALASGPAPEQVADMEAPPGPAGLRFAGFVGMIDPLRPGVREAVADCKRAGITVCMVTGDHPVTALAIARDLRLADSSDQVVVGSDLTDQPPEQLREIVRKTRVFARVTPRQKLEIVEAARDMGHFVAVTGDGVNDAPALRAANIGVAMGKMGTDVARESSELVISDDNFATIVAGVEEGRVAYDNIRKVVFLLISTGAAEVLLLGLAIITGTPLPLTPVQILWLNLATNGVQDVALAFEPAEGDVLHRRPRPPAEPIFNRLMIERTVVSAVVMAAVGYVTFRWFLGGPQHWNDPVRIASAQNTLLLLMVLFENIHLGNSRSETKSALVMSPLKSPVLLGCALVAMLLHIAMLYFPWGQAVLGTEPVAPATFGMLFGFALTVFVAMELHKWSWAVRHKAGRTISGGLSMRG